MDQQQKGIQSPTKLVVVKLGGAAVTMKNELETLQVDALACTARQLAIVSTDTPFVVIHGAGSFGHHQASHYHVAQGGTDSLNVRKGFALTRLSVTKLNHAVVSALLEEGVSACGISPSGSWITSGREVEVGDTSILRKFLEAGLTPVLHGDAVLDSQLGCTILSGDTIAKHLAMELHPAYVVFLTNVAGVYDRPPEEEGAKLFHRILVKPDGTWRAEGSEEQARFSTAPYDTTGGIAKKVQEAAAVAVLGIDVLIAKVATPDALRALQLGSEVLHQGVGAPWTGTVVQLEQK